MYRQPRQPIAVRAIRRGAKGRVLKVIRRLPGTVYLFRKPLEAKPPGPDRHAIGTVSPCAVGMPRTLQAVISHGPWLCRSIEDSSADSGQRLRPTAPVQQRFQILRSVRPVRVVPLLDGAVDAGPNVVVKQRSAMAGSHAPATSTTQTAAAGPPHRPDTKTLGLEPGSPFAARECPQPTPSFSLSSSRRACSTGSV